MEWSDLTEGAKAVLEQTRNIRNDKIQIVEFEIGYEQDEESAGEGVPVSIQEEDYQSLKTYTQENEYGEQYHMARNKNIVKIILLDKGKIPDNLSEYPVFREYKTPIEHEQAYVSDENAEEE
ncbi:hypothetical protein [Salisediminibacterium halotolerans]|uniref:Uncharacterized protein n=1 Tax=Salisediminibacterium halotolerans TaxID=517425 RepID=A0A1H9PGB8_9BACI|nr:MULTISPECIES: hypothetical protein [Salisediminibacterium]RLJ78080.1 hypothetical protein BCL39_0546 [Actinophytocola xinjiangensis]RPE88582.1 hypothetical protein EDD67_0913 [Salisediminibacterium halotolerans]TWG37057.1 hypothetical protein BCL52_0545 [Salisediminibacterium halotolerans]SER47208.1 hypothetical protein SAMN05444126_101203 [Salisediminibacterium haloalkalitolerans]GEL06911.1 hypothetical protein SHA02_03270 [Salisediminibacterium halotolerans]